MSTLKDRLDWALARQGWTQAEFARRSGLSTAVIGMWMGRATREISVKTLWDASEALDVIPKWLATGKGPRTPAEKDANEKHGESSATAKITRWIENLPKKERDAWLQIAESRAKEGS